MNWFADYILFRWSLYSIPRQFLLHHRLLYNSKSVYKTFNSLTDHILRRVSHLFDLKMAPLCKLVLVLDPRLSFEQEPLRETLIVGYEYGFEILKSRVPFPSSLEYK